MKRIALWLLFAVPLSAQIVTPLLQPHQFFVDTATGGTPCAGCSLYSYAAGTTTPQPTFTDSTGGTQNANPVVLDASGSAVIWVSSALSYKFVLQDALGNTLWTEDNIASVFPCPSSAAGGITCSGTGTFGTLEVKNSPWIDVRAWGAKCDGVTNDSTAIQNAINNACLSNNVPVLVPGHCVANITACNGMNLEGLNQNFAIETGSNSPPSMLIDGSSGATPILTINGTVDAGNGYGITGIAFHGTGSGAHDIGIYNTGSSGHNAHRVTLWNDTFNNFGQQCIYNDLSSSSPMSISHTSTENCVLNRTQAAKIGAIDIQATDSWLDTVETTASSNSVMYNSPPMIAALKLSGTNMFISNIVAEESEIGIYFDTDAGTIRLINSRADLNGGPGIWMEQNGASPQQGFSQITNVLARNNGLAANNTYDNWYVLSNQNNVFTNDYSLAEETAVQPRYHFNDSSTPTATAFNCWRDANFFSRGGTVTANIYLPNGPFSAITSPTAGPVTWGCGTELTIGTYNNPSKALYLLGASGDLEFWDPTATYRLQVGVFGSPASNTQLKFPLAVNGFLAALAAAETWTGIQTFTSVPVFTNGFTVAAATMLGVTGGGSYISSAILGGTPTYTAGTNVSSCAQASGYTNQNNRGAVTIVGGTATTGTICTVNFSTTLTAAPGLCMVIQNGGAALYDVGHGAATTSGFAITAGLTVTGATLTVDYVCKP